ncbi:hypothetical protein PENTCL1PPCAC_1840, partial [Pristionchus entomophagus]
FDMHLTTLDYASICVYSTSGFLGVVGNALLLLAIKYRSPASWKSYTILLANCAMIDFVACLSTWMSIERFVPFKEVTTSVYLGPCGLVSGFLCHIFHSVMLHSVTHSLFLLVIAFCYRLYVLGRSPPSKLNMVIFCIGIYFPTFSILVASFFTNDPSDEVRVALQLLFPDHDQFEGYVIEGHVDTQPRPLSKFIQAYMIGPIVPLCILVFIVRQKVIGKIKAKEDVMTERTREMHRSLVKVLTLQASLPILFLLSVISFIIVKRQLYDSPFFEHSIFWYISFMPALAPIITIYNVAPFRNSIEMTILDTISIVIHSTTGVYGIVGNLALLLAIKYKTPPSLKSYSVLLANCALIDIIACASTSLTIERMIAFTDMTANVYLGPCSIVSGFFCHILHSVMLQTNTHSLFLIVSAFCYRYYVIRRQAPSPIKVLVFCIAIYLPTLVIVILGLFINDSSDLVRDAFRVHHPDHLLDGYVLEGHVDFNPRPLSVVIQIYMIGPVIPLLCIVFIVRRKV